MNFWWLHEEIRECQAQEQQKVTASLQAGNDGEKIRQQVEQGLQEAQKQEVKWAMVSTGLPQLSATTSWPASMLRSHWKPFRSQC
ncbi:hypothetical protein [Deinococcus cellulosilyticus]|uniref:hypothetical protein n=1 Tax=Deinococcus cellulosilyticus TaxID=401558 RepID=UPI0011BFD690|nr:hypothetical protein [Deinococcus cellulosilyticus]